MSEFKFACPVCGQHMMCDSSQGGSVMECPTCFQKIVAPQAPAPDAKFILTGTKLTEKKIHVLPDGSTATAARPQKGFPATAWLLLAVIVLAAAGAGVYFFKDRLFAMHYEWRSHDVGSVRKAGTFSQKNGEFTVSGDGADIWSQADAFHFVYVKVTGDAEIAGQVLSVKNTDAWAKAGLMFRDTLKPESQFALLAVTPGSGVTFQTRAMTRGDASVVSTTPNVAAPRWLRLKREGKNFSAYSSPDGAAWTPLGSAGISMGGQIYVGLAVSSHNEGELCQARFAQLSLKGFVQAAPAVTNTPAAKPAPVAPPASDIKWMLTLDTNPIPDTPVAGRIHGKDFIIERASFQNGTLTLRAGTKGSVEFGALINFGSILPEALSGQSINVTTDADKAAKVSVRWKDDAGVVQKESHTRGYAMRLEFGALANNRLPGKIWLCLPDSDRSYLLGSFDADARKPKPKPPANQ